MQLVFQVKRVLDQMDKLGHEHTNVDVLANEASKQLRMFELSPAVMRAREYAKYELKCMAQGRKPRSLAYWLKMQRFI